MRVKIREAKQKPVGETITLCGWVRTIRKQKSFCFIDLNDGSTLKGFQIIADAQLTENIHTGTSLRVTGEIVESPGAGQSTELSAKEIHVFDPCAREDYPLQKKRHSAEFLRTIAHLRPRTNLQGAIIRMRNTLAYASHRFFQERGFFYINTPIITSSDCEGAGDMFQVTTLDVKKGQRDFDDDFFGRQAFLTVSGQLNSEAVAHAMSDVYTFGPTFRSENSNTSRHLAEFWMIEPEMAFYDLSDTMTLAQDYLKYLVDAALTSHPEEMELFDKFVEKGLIDRLTKVKEKDFKRMPYTEAIEILENSGKKFEFPHEWGCDLQSEHERYLAEEHVKGPVILYDYPRDLKAFYMRNNDDDKTVAAMDVLVPKVGELMGGSQREERYDILLEKCKAADFDLETYKWYLDLRQYGSVPHSGFGLGFERLIQFITGVENIRDVILFPRYPGHCNY
ncbi:MAG: asparagine--tRNA ligase [Simkaniaceae bacterium]|nr:asparagine--tRNA ligase [Simkaniaceae bacterium]